MNRITRAGMIVKSSLGVSVPRVCSSQQACPNSSRYSSYISSSERGGGTRCYPFQVQVTVSVSAVTRIASAPKMSSASMIEPTTVAES